MTEFSVEVRKSDRATCRMCGKKINENLLRLVWNGLSNNHNVKYYYCKECAIERLNYNIKELEKMKIQINEDRK